MGLAEDDTLRLPPPRRPGVGIGAWIGVALAVTLAGIGGTAWVVSGGAPPAPATAVVPLPSRPAIALASEAELAALLPERPMLRRLAENPRIFVLLFPDLELQGAALNRAAALIEKAGLPRDRLLDPAELAVVIARAGDTPATWFLGHDYRGEDLARVFALAERDRVALSEAELWVRAQLALALAEAGPGPLALVSVAGPGPQMDAAMRATVLRHEIGHGHYFTIPGFAAHVHAVWQGRFTAAERAAFRDFLGREGYEATNDDLMANETMAYLLFTPDARFFAPAMVGMTEPGVERLRGLLRVGLPRP